MGAWVIAKERAECRTAYGIEVLIENIDGRGAVRAFPRQAKIRGADIRA